MTYKRTLTVVALVAVIGVAFYAGMATERSGVALPSPQVVGDAHAQTMGSYTICDLYDAFTSLEDAFGFFADVLDGVRCAHVNCDRVFEAPTDALVDLDWFKFQEWAGGGGIPCRTDPCKLPPEALFEKLNEVLERVPSISPRLSQILEEVPREEIEYMTDMRVPKGAK